MAGMLPCFTLSYFFVFNSTLRMSDKDGSRFRQTCIESPEQRRSTLLRRALLGRTDVVTVSRVLGAMMCVSDIGTQAVHAKSVENKLPRK